jgi:hypothetical protein
MLYRFQEYQARILPDIGALSVTPLVKSEKPQPGIGLTGEDV